MEVALDVLKTAGERSLDSRSTTSRPISAGSPSTTTAPPSRSSTRSLRERGDPLRLGRWPQVGIPPPKEQPERAALLPIRKAFSLYANVRPGLLFPELTDASPLKKERIPDGIDIVCIRELTGGIYFGQPKATTDAGKRRRAGHRHHGLQTSEIERIAQVAIDTARARGKRVCSVDKANVLETSVLWRKVVTEYFAKHAPEIELSHMYVDNAAMQLARDPNQFDVLFTENMFGDILSDEMGVICGSLGMLASASLGASKTASASLRSLRAFRRHRPRHRRSGHRQPLRSDPLPPSCSATASVSSKRPPPSKPPWKKPSPAAPAPATSPSASTPSTPKPWDAAWPSSESPANSANIEFMLFEPQMNADGR